MKIQRSPTKGLLRALMTMLSALALLGLTQCKQASVAGMGSSCRVCETPPANSCLSPTELQSYGETGVCENDVCVYTETTVACEFGCDPDVLACAAEGDLCELGYGMNTDGECVDIDECARDTSPCPESATCTNTEGSYTCTCASGYELVDDACADIDECTLETDDCAAELHCQNTAGSFTCACDNGFELSDDACVDIDECTLETDDCVSTATCTNTSGNYTCACPSGYTGDGLSSGSDCTDIDECSDGSDNCDDLATCANTDGAYTCTCPDGYHGDGTTCDENVCEALSAPANGTVNVVDNAGGKVATYACEEGYALSDGSATRTCGDTWEWTGSAPTCENVDECAEGTHACQEDSFCVDTTGSYACRCDNTVAASALPPDTVFVDAAAVDGGDGTSWAKAYNNLYEVLEDVAANQSVWVVEGTYKPEDDGSGRDASFVLRNNIEIYGGFRGCEHQLAQRDASTYATILSGDIGTASDSTDNVYHVVITEDGQLINESSVLDGFTVRDGYANGSDARGQGGGIYLYSDWPTLKNITFTSNQANQGGAMYNYASATTIESCTFSANSSIALDGTGHGGAIYNEISDPTLTDTLFENNTSAAHGGAIYNEGSPSITGCTFTGNQSGSSGGAIYNDMPSSDATLIAQTSFINNESNGGDGGAIFNNNTDGASTDNESVLMIHNSIFSRNASSGDGGAIANLNSYPMIASCSFSNNGADGDGEAIHTNQAIGSDPGLETTKIYNSLFWNHTGSEVVADSGAPDVQYCILESGDYSGNGGVLALDPLYVNAAADNLSLDETSPAIDAGDNTLVLGTLDRDGNARIQDGDADASADIDMGAYEHEP